MCVTGKRANCEGGIFEVDFTGSEEDARLDGSDICRHPNGEDMLALSGSRSAYK